MQLNDWTNESQSKKIYLFRGMNKVKVKDQVFELESSKDGLSGTINGKPYSLDIIESGKDRFHVLYEHKSIIIHLLEVSDDKKTARIQVNGKTVSLTLEDQFDLLLKNLGINVNAGKKVNEIKAPMPGLVLRFSAQEGDMVKKGDALLVLEAMKMENVIKAPEDVTVSKIHVTQGQAVEKNQLLMSFA